jgi:hypothetical protein
MKLVGRDYAGWAAIIAVALAVAGCGGGGGSGGTGAPTGGSGGVPTGSSSPSPAPTSSITFGSPPAPFGLTSTTPFTIIGWQERSGVVAPAGDRGQLTWSATLKTYTLKLADLDSGPLAYTFPPSNQALAFSVIKPDGAKGNVYVTLVPNGAALGQLFWQSADGVSPFVYAQAIFGIAASAGALPSTGRKVFVTGDAPASQIVIDLATRKVSGTINEQFDNGWDPEGPIEHATLVPTDLAADGSFVATFSVQGTSTTGQLRGQLMGASGDELAVYWNGPVRGPYGPVFEPWRDVASFTVCVGCG